MNQRYGIRRAATTVQHPRTLLQRVDLGRNDEFISDNPLAVWVNIETPTLPHVNVPAEVAKVTLA